MQISSLSTWVEWIVIVQQWAWILYNVTLVKYLFLDLANNFLLRLFSVLQCSCLTFWNILIYSLCAQKNFEITQLSNTGSFVYECSFCSLRTYNLKSSKSVCKNFQDQIWRADGWMNDARHFWNLIWCSYGKNIVVKCIKVIFYSSSNLPTLMHIVVLLAVLFVFYSPL